MGKTKRIGAEPDEKKVMKEDGGKRKKVKGTGGTGRGKEGVMEMGIVEREKQGRAIM